MSNLIRALAQSDVTQAFGLSQAAGWDQTTEDWSLAIEMNPDGCFAMEVDGALVATTTTIRYRTDLAWIGMVLTHPEYRGRGFARALMECALDVLAGVETVKLDATEMGEPLYRQLGFVDDGAIERWVRPVLPGATCAAKEFVANPQLDREAFGADRGALLERLAKIEAVSFGGDAFAMGRPSKGIQRFGPCASRSAEGARALLEWFVARHANEPILWDLLPDNRAASELAQSMGFERSRRLTRMSRGGKLRSDNSLVYAGAGFEFG
jgi:GNAT superfamily N-acetyltransferase